MTEIRAQIHAYLRDHPGVHVSGLVRDLDLAPGQVQHHLATLRRQGAVVAERYRGRTHYFPQEYDVDDRRAIAVLRRETARDILSLLIEAGPTRPTTVTQELDIARSTLEYHLEALAAVDLVAKHRTDAGHVTLYVPDPEPTLTLLAETSPRTIDRFRDRFTRLFDTLLEGD